MVLEDGAQLPDGAEVEVRLLEPSFQRDDVFAQVLANRITYDVGIDQMIEEDKQERRSTQRHDSNPSASITRPHTIRTPDLRWHIPRRVALPL